MNMSYNNEEGGPDLGDLVPQPSGLGMEVVYVKCDFLDPGWDLPTQDFEFHSMTAIESTGAKLTREIFELRVKLLVMRR